MINFKSNLKSNLKFKSQKTTYIVAIVLILIVLGIIGTRQFLASLFFSKKDRINVVVYGKDTLFYSFGRTDGVNYFISFFPDIKINVPGGYGKYRVGGIGRLAFQEKNPDLIQTSFSAVTSATVDLYFYDNSSNIYYGTSVIQENKISPPALQSIFFMHSNGNIFDRIFLALLAAGRSGSELTPIIYTSLDVDGEDVLKDRDFGKKYLGYLFNKTFRSEQKTVQIHYSSRARPNNNYRTALAISRIIEGDGIRVVDITEDATRTECEVYESGGIFSQSAKHLSAFFGCSLHRGNVESADIAIYLGSLEKSWEMVY